MMAESDELERGRGELRDRVAPVVPPPELGRRVRESLASRGLVKVRGQRRGAWPARLGLLVAGLLIGFFARGAFGNDRARPSEARAGQYVLLLYGDTPGDTGVVHAEREREYGQWATSLENARWVGGQELGDVVAELGPPTAGGSADHRLAGYFVIDAPSRERAREVARTCPHLKYGGRVVVMAVAS